MVARASTEEPYFFRHTGGGLWFDLWLSYIGRYVRILYNLRYFKEKQNLHINYVVILRIAWGT